MPEAPRRALAPLAVAGAAVVLRLPFLDWPMVSDEGGYAYTARWWADGLTLYSAELWFDRPQGIFLAYRAGLALLGGETGAIRLWGALQAAATAAVAVVLTRELLRGRVAGAGDAEGRRADGAERAASWGAPALAGLLVALLSVQPAVEGFTANAELFALLPATLAAWLLLRERWALAGLAASAAFMLKPSGGTVALLAVAWLVHRRAPGRAWLALGLAGLSLPLAGLLHGAATVGTEAYLRAVAGFRLGVEDPLGLGPVEAALDTLPVWLPALALACAGLAAAGRRERVFVGAWLASAAAGIAMGGNWFWHYFVQAVPPLAVGAALGCRALWRAGGATMRVAAAVPVAVPVLLLLPAAAATPEEGAWELYRRPGYRVADEAAAALAARTAPDEPVYVAFAEAEIYHLAGRRSAFPHLYWLELLRMPGAYEALLDTVAARAPASIFVLTRTPEALDPDDRFRTLVERGYAVDTLIHGRPLYRRR